MFRLLRNWWWAHQRRTDLALLWPACKETTPTLEQARQVFLIHAISDDCWVRYYGERLAEIVYALE